MTGTQLPSYKDYIDALSFPAITLSDPNLKAGEAVKGRRGLITFAGQFALTAAFHDASQTKWALRCFSRLPRDIEQRYHAVSYFVRHSKTNILVNIDYQAEGIRVNNAWYPLCKMEWVEGDTLNKFIEKHRDNPQRINILSAQFVDLIFELQTLECAHGDLHQMNIICDDARLRLVDYDGMFVPEFANQDLLANEIGHPHYQHPKRTEQHFNEEIDRFSAISIYLSLKLLAKLLTDDPKRELLGDELLFTKKDYLAPRQSANIALLQKYGFERAAQYFRQICEGAFEAVPLLQEFISADNRLAQEYALDQQAKKEYRPANGAMKHVKVKPATTAAPPMPKTRNGATRKPPRATSPSALPDHLTRKERQAFGPIEDSQSFVPMNSGASPSQPISANPTSAGAAINPATRPTSAGLSNGLSAQPSAASSPTSIKPPSQTTKPPAAISVKPNTPVSRGAVQASSAVSTQKTKVVAAASPAAAPPYTPSSSIPTTERVAHTRFASFMLHWTFVQVFSYTFVSLAAGGAAFAAAVLLQLLGGASGGVQAIIERLQTSGIVVVLVAMSAVGGWGVAFVTYPRALPDLSGYDSRWRRGWRLLTALYLCLPAQDNLIGFAQRIYSTTEPEPIPLAILNQYALYMGIAAAVFVFLVREVWRRVIRIPELNPKWLEDREKLFLTVVNNLRFYGLSLTLVFISLLVGVVYYQWRGTNMPLDMFLGVYQFDKLFNVPQDALWVTGMAALGLGALVYQKPSHRVGVWDQRWLRLLGFALCTLYVLAVYSSPSIYQDTVVNIVIGVALATVALLPVQRALS